MTDLQILTREFGSSIIQFLKSNQGDWIDRILAHQLVRSATSVGANYRAARRARSNADMIAKLKLVEEECDESIYWLELLRETKMFSDEDAARLLDQADHILRMTVNSIKTLRAKATTPH